MPKNDTMIYLSIHRVFRDATVPNHLIIRLIFCWTLLLPITVIESILQVTDQLQGEQVFRAGCGTDTSGDGRALITAESITDITNAGLFILIGLIIVLSGLFFVGLLYHGMDQNLKL